MTQPQICPLPAGADPTKVACGLDHTLVACADGRLISFGDNSLQQLGRPVGSYAAGDQAADEWVVCDGAGAPLQVVDVACGLAHSLAITRDHQVRSIALKVVLSSSFCS